MYKEDANRPRSGTFQERGTNYDTKQFQRFRAKQNDVTASRAINGTVYQNTTGKVLSVVISVGCAVYKVNTTGVNGWSQVLFYTGATSTPATVVGAVSNSFFVAGLAAGGGAQNSISGTVTFEVPINYYYKAVSAYGSDGSAPSKNSWIETQLF